MKINISFILAISMPLISSGVVFNHALHTIKNTKQQSPIIYHTHAEQMVHTDGNDVNTDFDVVK
jgi:hypothetical protein